MVGLQLGYGWVMGALWSCGNIFNIIKYNLDDSQSISCVHVEVPYLCEVKYSISPKIFMLHKIL